MATTGEDDRTDSCELSKRDCSLLIISFVIAVVLGLSGLRDATDGSPILVMEVGLPLLIAGGVGYVLLRGRS